MTRAYTIVLGIFMLLGLSCEKETFRQSESGYPIELTAVVNENGQVELSWTELKAAGFENYMVLRAANPISDQIFVTYQYSIVKYFTSRFQNNSWVDEAPPPAKTWYYKVVALLDGRQVVSPTIQVDFDLEFFDFFVDRWSVLPKENLVVLIDNDTKLATVFDYSKDEVMGSIELQLKTDKVFLQSTPDDQAALFIIAAPDYKQVKIIHARTFEELGTFYSDNAIKSLATDHDMICLVTNNEEFPMVILDGHTFSKIAQFEQVILKIP